MPAQHRVALCLLAVLLVIVALALPWLQSLPLQRQFSAQRHAPPTCHMCRAVVQDVCVLQESQVAADRVCVACQDQRANTVLVPCGHGARAARLLGAPAPSWRMHALQVACVKTVSIPCLLRMPR